MFRYLAEPRNILAEPLGSTEPRLKNTDLESKGQARLIIAIDCFGFNFLTNLCKTELFFCLVYCEWIFIMKYWKETAPNTEYLDLLMYIFLQYFSPFEKAIFRL